MRQIKKLEAEMFRKARNLEFEEAAKLRDEIDRLRQLELGVPKSRSRPPLVALDEFIFQYPA